MSQQNGTINVNPEVMAKAERRHFSAQYKQRILVEADACTERGQIGAVLRREGLYAAHLDTWRKQRQQGALKALASQKRGPKPDLQVRVKQAETIIDVQKNSPCCLG